MTQLRQVAPIFASVILGCGSLKTPDLQHGVVTGRIAGAQQGAYAYVFGKPEVIAPVGSDGSFRLEGVPTGEPQIVLFDGANGAESVLVEVEGATESHLEIDRPLELASAIVAVHSPVNGTRSTGLRFTVVGTPLVQVDGEAGARLFPLPSGKFTVRAEQAGFVDHDSELDIGEGQSASLEVELEFENDDRGGCRTSGCEEGLSCSNSDGHCYPTSPQTEGMICQGCQDAGNCQSGLLCTSGNYCSAPCDNSSTCPSGYECQDKVCVAPKGCLALIATYGSACSRDDSCQALKDGKCLPLDRTSGAVGYCSARRQVSCPIGFTSAGATDPNEYCVWTSP